MAQSNEFSVMNLLQQSGILKQPIFSVFLSDSEEERSEITFGDVKKEHMASELYWVPVSGTAGYWEVQERLRESWECRWRLKTSTSTTKLSWAA